jgi:hypothetical protein
MALIFCDGFDAYASAAEFSDKWNSVNASLTYLATGGRFGGGAVNNGATSSGALSRNFAAPIGGAGVTIGAGCWFKSTSYHAESAPSLTAIGNAGIFLGSSTALQLEFPNGSFSSSVTCSILDGNWHWIEWAILQAATAIGTWSIWIDGVLAGSATGITTGVGTATIVAVTPTATTTNTTSICQVIFWDSTGSAFNTFPLGPRRISTLIPNGAGASTQYTPSTGTNWSCVAGAYSAATFVSSTVTGQIDLYTYPNLPIVPSTINAVVGNYFGQNSGVGAAQNTPKMRTSSTTVSGTAVTLPNGTNASSQFAWYADAGGSAWTDTSVNAVQLGMGD